MKTELCGVCHGEADDPMVGRCGQPLQHWLCVGCSLMVQQWLDWRQAIYPSVTIEFAADVISAAKNGCPMNVPSSDGVRTLANVSEFFQYRYQEAG